MEPTNLSNPLVITLRNRKELFDDTDVGSVHIPLKELPVGDELVGWYDIKPTTGVATRAMRLKVGLLLGIPRLLSTSMIVPISQRQRSRPPPLPIAVRSPV
jgi:hypothetical protein